MLEVLRIGKLNLVDLSGASAFILEMFYQIHDVCLNLMNEFNLILYSFVNRRKPDKQDKVLWARTDHHSKIRKLFDVEM